MFVGGIVDGSRCCVAVRGLRIVVKHTRLLIRQIGNLSRFGLLSDGSLDTVVLAVRLHADQDENEEVTAMSVAVMK